MHVRGTRPPCLGTRRSLVWERDPQKGVSEMDNLPNEVLCRIFSHLQSPEDLCRCAGVCRRWSALLEPSSEVWAVLLVEHTPQEFRNDALLTDLITPKAKLAAFACAWNDNDRSENIHIKKNRLTLHRNPVAQSTDAIRGKVGFSSGEHYWRVVWHGPNFGSSAVVGVSTKECKLHGGGYFPLLGNDSESWGWDLSDNVLRHSGDVDSTFPRHEDSKVSWPLQSSLTRHQP